MNKEETMIGKNLIPDGLTSQIRITEEKEEDCLIWISPKAIYLANEIDFARQTRDKLYNFINSEEFEKNFESKNNSQYIRAKIKNIMGFVMSLDDFEIIEGDSNE